jgi:hypothetical protein
MKTKEKSEAAILLMDIDGDTANLEGDEAKILGITLFQDEVGEGVIELQNLT